ncbi:undecaprenyl-diphosphatase UppP [candidate division WWE3 bacterium RIFCSPHIGHO2_12_FULL_38_15]|uniref:Undecaprenyl-diphosphatase n=1 Tax=candidate division WWE3 bacterium RIFCSPHIGHO2_02_FULL_38_14 TaxID=1802620 RepID=A0A1F4VB26_UNCKA|nr:MAG: undecaprenyl-diphosphatase UppP [candidate division WWE3 bacterium RIFCSPHIGHO2_01_FULL_38_45]OGC49063.1 MAG: undecaprenyl-diphosphatase UppP [candidate division WWE3 bacterium RIFCSPHIGHO2_12_FULL_38_15]OGC53518.1 MAG: undecaprenyl-diphosphatase UppP [candidate division WWE3 bacterium RIFCSPLOWO2_01_FULL_37_24]OGC54422.1 MAG: undecaprenyl-diphosphatase UppP [candidate division WWE3 bacterium RIFCSPHIGHO2_02_FULL_38_14]HLB51667.1 undecaprenyl-diphosphatase UppP [Patescibacteria group ba
MIIFQALVLGAVQGLTEFLPVSSSAHLIIVPSLLGWDKQPLVFDTTLHLATALALVIYFFNDLKKILSALFSDYYSSKLVFNKYSSEGKLGIYILIGTIPAGVVGLLFGNLIENSFREITGTITFLAVGTFLLLLAEKYYSKKNGKVLGEKLNFAKSLFIGFFQSLALLPGISRSGATISSGMFSGLSREEAARFSFLLSVPVVIMAAMFKILSSSQDFNQAFLPEILAGFVSSIIFSLIAIKFLMSFVKKNKLYIFAVYRILLIIVLLFL